MKWFVELQYDQNGSHVYTNLEAETPGEAIDKAIAAEARGWSDQNDNFPSYPQWSVRPASYVASEWEAQKAASAEKDRVLALCWSLRKETR